MGSRVTAAAHIDMGVYDHEQSTFYKYHILHVSFMIIAAAIFIQLAILF